MDMMLMLGILALIYFTIVIVLCLYRYKIRNLKFWNLVFIVADIAAFFCWTYAAYLEGWLHDGWLTLGNISPLMFTMILLTPFMKEGLRDYVYSAIAFLHLGMFLAMLLSPEYVYLFGFHREASLLYTSEAACHLICALFGIYLVLSGQVNADFKHWAKSLAFIYTVIGTSVLLNYIFHRDYFGMDPYGDYSIYMIDIFGSFGATLLAYFAGIALTITVGWQSIRFLDTFTAKFFHIATEEELMEEAENAEKNDTPLDVALAEAHEETETAV